MRKPGRMLAVALLALLAPAPHAALAASGPPPPAEAAPAPAVALDRAFMVGFWTDDDDCGDVIEFAPDGRFVAANGGTGRWNLKGDRMTMTGRTTETIRVIPIDRDTIDVVNGDGSLGRSTRCAAPDAADAPVRSDIA